MILEARGISKSFGELEVLKNVDLQLQKAELLGIVGKSGSGKSTLLHILGTLDMADGGSIYFEGEDIAGWPTSKVTSLRNLHFGFIFQFHYLLAEFDALENVMLPGMVARKDKSTLKTKAKELLDYVGLAERMHHKPSQLSGGEKQRVAIARALINEPQVVFADEPTGNLDSETSLDIQQLFLRLQEELDQSMVIVTHQQELANLCHRSLTMEDGQLIHSISQNTSA